MKERKQYSKEFKQEAVRLLNLGEKPSAQLAMELGVKRTLLYRWRDQMNAKGEAAFNRKTGPKPCNQEEENARLRKELAQVKEERDILKKAAAYFAKELR
jgi:transposase